MNWMILAGKQDIMAILPHKRIILLLSFIILLNTKFGNFWSVTALSARGCDGFGVYGASIVIYGQLELFETQ